MTAHDTSSDTASSSVLRRPILPSINQSIDQSYTVRGATTAEKLRATKVWVPTPGRLRPAPGQTAPGQRPGWVLGAGGGRSLPLWRNSHCEGPGVSPGKIFENSDAKSCILATTMLIAMKFLAFWKLRPRSWGTNALLVPQPISWGTSPQPKSWGTSLPGSYGCCAYVRSKNNSWYTKTQTKRRK